MICFQENWEKNIDFPKKLWKIHKTVEKNFDIS